MYVPNENNNNGSFGSNRYESRIRDWGEPRRNVQKRRFQNRESTQDVLARLAEEALSDSNGVGYITPEGHIMPRADAFRRGQQNGISMLKDRIWGCDDDEVNDESLSLDDVQSWTVEEPETAENENKECLMEFDRHKLMFSEEALERIVSETIGCEKSETGGALIGSWARGSDGSLSICVERATGPGGGAQCEEYRFSPSMAYYSQRLGYYREAQNWDYLGEWHRHPGEFNELSDQDLNTARELLDEEKWPFLILPIVNVDGRTAKITFNVILSGQLGGQTFTHIGTITRQGSMTMRQVSAYLDTRMIEQFRDSGENEQYAAGTYNDGASYVFLSQPGHENAVLRLVRASGGDVSVGGEEGVLTAVVGEDDVTCCHVVEGELLPVKAVLIDPRCSVYERNAGLLETTVLKDKSVCLVGCGSVGSTMALSLARAGVGHFALFDGDVLSPVNIARHQGHLSDLGRAKTEVVRDLIHGVDPSIAVECYSADIVKDPEGTRMFRAEAEKSDLLVCTTDTDDSRMLVNRVAVELHVCSLQAGLHSRAASGVVHLYDPDQSDHACFACHRRQILCESDKRNENVAYSEAENIRDLTVQPGLSAQINLVAEIAALRAIDAMMGRRSLPDLTVIGIDEPDSESSEDRCLHLSISHLDVAAAPGCPVCGVEADESDDTEAVSEESVADEDELPEETESEQVSDAEIWDEDDASDADLAEAGTAVDDSPAGCTDDESSVWY